jgi:hypothetical protein
LALQLLGFEIHGRGQAATFTEPGPVLLRGGQFFRLPEDGQTRECSREDLRRALALSERIPEGAINLPEGRPEIALHRFRLGVAEANDTDVGDRRAGVRRLWRRERAVSVGGMWCRVRVSDAAMVQGRYVILC